jgi:hypothetical protein
MLGEPGGRRSVIYKRGGLTHEFQVAALLEDRRVRQEETEVALKRSGEKLATLTSKLKQTQQLLYDSTRDFLDLKYEYRYGSRRELPAGFPPPNTMAKCLLAGQALLARE